MFDNSISPRQTASLLDTTNPHGHNCARRSLREKLFEAKASALVQNFESDEESEASVTIEERNRLTALSLFRRNDTINRCHRDHVHSQPAAGTTNRESTDDPSGGKTRTMQTKPSTRIASRQAFGAAVCTEAKRCQDEGEITYTTENVSHGLIEMSFQASQMKSRLKYIEKLSRESADVSRDLGKARSHNVGSVTRRKVEHAKLFLRTDVESDRFRELELNPASLELENPLAPAPSHPAARFEEKIPLTKISAASALIGSKHKKDRWRHPSLRNLEDRHLVSQGSARMHAASTSEPSKVEQRKRKEKLSHIREFEDKGIPKLQARITGRTGSL